MVQTEAGLTVSDASSAPAVVAVNAYITDICLAYRLMRPHVVIAASRRVFVRLRGLPWIGRSVIEVSRGATELLDQRELVAVVAHELGHVRQGLWRVATLKLLSMLAMFPNYYLTLCVDWARREIEADRFALATTGDPKALRRALIKLSTAQVSALNVSVDRHRSGIGRRLLRTAATAIRTKWLEMTSSVRFFFGDGLLGYVHPYLSERLTAIGAHVADAVQSSDSTHEA